MAEKDNKLVSNGVYSILADTWLKEPVASEIPDIDQAEVDKEAQVWEDRYNEIVDRAEKELIGFTPDAPNSEAEKTSETTESDSDCTGEGCARTEKIISDQIRGEWEAIRNYQQAIDDLEKSNMDFDNVIKLLDDISDEELVHVGELTQALTDIKSNTSSEIDKGAAEAEEKLANPVQTEKLTEEVHTDLIDAIDSFLDEIYIARQDGLNDEGEYSIRNLVFKELRNKGCFDRLKDLKNQLISKELSVKDTAKPAVLEEPAMLEEAGGSMKDVVERQTKFYTKENGMIPCNYGKQAEEVMALLSKHYPKVELDNKKPSRAMIRFSKKANEDTEKVKDGKWVNRGEEGTHGTFKTKREADAQRKAMFANGFHEDIDPSEEPPEEEKRRKYWLTPKQRYQYRIELSRISHNAALIQENGLFNIYHVQERDLQQILMRIRQLDYIEWVQETPGAYDFSHPEFGRPQPRYHQIYGKIKTD